VLAIDPGQTQSGWVLLEGREVVQSGVDDNHELLVWVKHGQHADMLAIEMIASMGMTVGQSVFETVRWIGRFQQAWRYPESVRFVKRVEVKHFLCGTHQAKDTNVRQALLDLVGPQGVKAKPGPTYGVKSHAWQALGVAVTAMSLREHPGLPMVPQPAENVPA
jgi:hypothetical protein